MGTILVVTGLIGFVVDDLIGLHLSYTHNAIYIATGALTIWFGFDSIINAKRAAYTFGVVYGLLGLLGFLLGTPGLPSMGYVVQDPALWKIAPEILEFGTVDHILHLVLGAALLLGATLKFKRLQAL